VAAGGGEFSQTVGRTTTALVVGSLNWPLNRRGRLTRKLQRAHQFRQLGKPIEIMDEQRFLLRCGVEAWLANERKIFSLADIERMIGASRDRILRLIRANVVEPVEWQQGLPFFDFADIRRLNSLLALLDAGVRLQDVRRGLQRLRHFLPWAEASMRSLGLLDSWGARIVVRSETGELWESSGQRLFDFESHEAAATVPLPRDLYAEAICCEEQQDLEGAIEAYTQLLRHEGPDADVCFQLANALYALGRLEAAAERFRQTVELEPDYAEAWNNLGNVLAELRRHGAAVQAYEYAVRIDPGWADARFGLADVLDECGRANEAAEHWRILLSMPADAEYVHHARERLAHHDR
jgi:tetratricopeptide (TPR) repeat protein